MALTHGKRMAYDYDGVGMIGTIADNNSPEKATEDGWSGSRYAQQEIAQRVLKDDIALTASMTTITMAMLKKIIETFFTNLGAPLAPALADPSAASTQITVKTNRVVHNVQYDGLWIQSLKLSASGPNAKLQAEIGLIGDTARNFSGGAPTAIVAALPLAIIDSTFTYNSVTQTPQSFEIMLNNNLEEDFANSKLRDDVGMGAFEATAAINLPVNSTSYGLFDNVLNDSGVSSFSVAITDGTDIVTITIPEMGVVGALPDPGDGVWRGDLPLVGFEPASGDIVTVAYT